MGLVGSYSHYKCLIVHNVGFEIYDDFSDVFLLLSVVKCLVAPVAGQLFAHNGPDEGSLQDENVVSIPELEELATHGYGSIPIHTIFRGMNIHLPAILMCTRGIGF